MLLLFFLCTISCSTSDNIAELHVDVERKLNRVGDSHWDFEEQQVAAFNAMGELGRAHIKLDPNNPIAIQMALYLDEDPLLHYEIMLKLYDMLTATSAYR